MKAVVLGAGRVGLGCAARIAAQSGLDVTVLARGASAEELTRHGMARVITTDRDHTDEVEVPLHALDLDLDGPRALREIAGADVVFTAVGASAVPGLAGLLAAGLDHARRPVDVIALENRADAGDHLRRAVSELTTSPVQHGFSGAVVDGVVAQRLPGTAEVPVRVVAEPHCEVIVDERALMSDWSWLSQVSGTSQFRAAYRRKLFRYSTGHAATAYVGALKGYRYVHAAIADPEVADWVRGAMEEGRRGLLHRYGPDIAGTPAELTEIIDRFANAALGDTTARVGADVPRKVARDERLVGAARLARKAGRWPRHLAFVVAAALRGELAAHTPSAVSGRVARLTGLPPTSPLIAGVCEVLDDLGDSPLLSIRDAVPAWESIAERNVS